MIHSESECSFILTVNYPFHLSLIQELIQGAEGDDLALATETAEELMYEGQPEDVFGSPKAGTGIWASCVRLFSPTEVSLQSSWTVSNYCINHSFLYVASSMSVLNWRNVCTYLSLYVVQHTGMYIHFSNLTHS